MMINGKQRHLSNRKYCLKCSPFGSHNTRKVFDGCKDQKYCKQCNHPLPSRRRNVCNSCHVRNYRQNVKKKLIEYKGGKCQICGYNKCVSSLTFHHKDPTQKEFNISGKSMSFKKLLKEVDKCELLCSNCHGEIHEGLIFVN